MKRLLAGLVLAPLVVFAAEPNAPASRAHPNNSVYTALLAKYVSKSGVDYASWTENAGDRGALAGYLASLQRVLPSQLDRFDALAYWINLYNAATLDLVLDHYPVKSIKDIGAPLSSPWKKEIATVEGKPLSLHQIENDVIRPTFLEPRVHFALNCASRSCPALRFEAYEGAVLDAQLDEQTSAFLANASTNYVDERGVLHLSQLFNWYASDFKKAKGSVPEFVAPYLPAFETLQGKDIPIQHEEYDWALNEAAMPR